jgi:hypothetical protein
VALTSSSEVLKLTREDFQSQIYQQAGYGTSLTAHPTLRLYAGICGWHPIDLMVQFYVIWQQSTPDPLADNGKFNFNLQIQWEKSDY